MPMRERKKSDTEAIGWFSCLFVCFVFIPFLSLLKQQGNTFYKMILNLKQKNESDPAIWPIEVRTFWNKSTVSI